MLFQAFRLWGRHRDLPARLLHEINAWVNRLIVRVGSLGTKSTESMKKSYLATYRETKNTDVIKIPILIYWFQSPYKLHWKSFFSFWVQFHDLKYSGTRLLRTPTGHATVSVLRRVLENSHGHMFYRHEYTKEQRMTEAQSQGSETCKMGSRKLHEIACSRLAYVYPHPPLCFSFVGGRVRLHVG